MKSTKSPGAWLWALNYRKINSRGSFIVAGGAFHPSSRKGRLLRSAAPHPGDWLPPPAPSGRNGRVGVPEILNTLLRLESSMHVLRTEVQMSRRKFMHFVFDEHSTLLFSCQRVEDALNWLHDQGHTTCRIEGQTCKFTVAFTKVPE